MALKTIVSLLALVGQITSQDQIAPQADHDDMQLYRNQEHLDSLPVLANKAIENRGFLSGLFQPRPYRPPRVPFLPHPPQVQFLPHPRQVPFPLPLPTQCQCLGYSMCAWNPYDKSEGCIDYCYGKYHPGLNINYHRWICGAYQRPSRPFGPPAPFQLGEAPPATQTQFREAFPLLEDTSPQGDATPGPYQ